MKSEIGGKVNGNRLNIDCVLKDVDYYVLSYSISIKLLLCHSLVRFVHCSANFWRLKWVTQQAMPFLPLP